jgi:O-antigen/teichoic acid export membrane protein
MRILIAGAKTSFGPSAAQVEQREGVAGLRPYIRHIFLLVGPVIGAYCLFLVIFAGPVLKLLFGGSFDEYAGLMPLFIVAYLTVEAFFAIEIGLRARRATDVLFHASLVAVISTWIFGPPLIHVFDLEGLLWLNLALSPIYGAVLWFRYQRELRDAPRKEAGSAAIESEGRAAYDAT